MRHAKKFVLRWGVPPLVVIGLVALVLGPYEFRARLDVGSLAASLMFIFCGLAALALSIEAIMGRRLLCASAFFYMAAGAIAISPFISQVPGLPGSVPLYIAASLILAALLVFFTNLKRL